MRERSVGDTMLQTWFSRILLSGRSRLRNVAIVIGGHACFFVAMFGIGACGHRTTSNRDVSPVEVPDTVAEHSLAAGADQDSRTENAEPDLDFWHATSPIESCDAQAWPSVWRSLVGAPSEGKHVSELSIKKEGQQMELRWQENNLPDDAVAAIAYRYFLRWDDDKRWELERCDKEILRCWRGPLREGRCP